LLTRYELTESEVSKTFLGIEEAKTILLHELDFLFVDFGRDQAEQSTHGSNHVDSLNTGRKDDFTFFIPDSCVPELVFLDVVGGDRGLLHLGHKNVQVD
jgi:hypothetical protein